MIRVLNSGYVPAMKRLGAGLHFTKELLEKNKRPWSLEVRFSGTDKVYTLEFDKLSYKDTVKAPQSWYLDR